MLSAPTPKKKEHKWLVVVRSKLVQCLLRTRSESYSRTPTPDPESLGGRPSISKSEVYLLLPTTGT
jgi:hypothetical protein